MKIKLETLRSEYEISVLFDRLIKTPHKIEIKLGRRIVNSNIISQKKDKVFLSEFTPFHANNLIKTLPNVNCIIKELDGFEEVTHYFKAKFVKESEQNYLPCFEYKIIGAIRGYKCPYLITPLTTDNTYVFIHIDENENLEIPIKKLSYEEIFFSQKHEELQPFLNKKIKNIAIGIPSDNPAKNKQLVFDGLYTHIYGNSYSLSGISESSYNRDSMLAYAKRNFILSNDIKFFNRDGTKVYEAKTKNNANKILIISEIDFIAKTFSKCLKFIGKYEIISKAYFDKINEYCDYFKPSLVVIDIDSNEISAKNINEWYLKQNIPFFVLSVSSSNKKLLQVLQFNASGYLIKPIDSTLLLKKLKSFYGPIKPKNPINLTNPLICYYCDNHSKNLNIIQALLNEFGNAESFMNKGLKVVNSVMRMKNYVGQNVVDFVIIDCSLNILTSVKIVEKLHLSRITANVKCVVLANNDVEEKLLSQLNDENCVIIKKQNSLNILKSLDEYSSKN